MIDISILITQTESRLKSAYRLGNDESIRYYENILSILESLAPNECDSCKIEY